MNKCFIGSFKYIHCNLRAIVPSYIYQYCKIIAYLFTVLNRENLVMLPFG